MSEVKFSIDRDELAAEIEAQFAQDATAGMYDDGLQRFMENEVVPVWQQNSRRTPGITSDRWRSNTPPRPARARSEHPSATPTSLNTGSVDTPEFAPRAKTAASFDDDSTGDYGKS
jgi:hypothetical protein